MLNVLMVAEKPSVAEAIAKALAPSVLNKTKVGAGLPSWIFSSTLEGEPCKVLVTSTTGHIFSLDFAPRFNDRNKVDETDLFGAEVLKKAESGSVIAHLNQCAKGMGHLDRLVLWLDCDKEGENICFEVIGILRKFLTPASKGQDLQSRIRRVKFSSLVASDLRAAYANKLVQPNECEALSVDARQELDLKIGVSFTRFLTRFLKDCHGGTVSYGPCQMPTLWFCVRRFDEIENFKPHKYYTLKATVFGSIDLHWAGGRIFDEATARAIRDVLAGTCGSAVVTKSRTKRRKSPKPLPFNTMDMLKKASTLLGMAPQRALSVAENLYLSGLITYPRTESTKFAPAFNLREVVDTLCRDDSVVHTMAKRLKEEGINPPTGGVDVGDHPPITPCNVCHTFSSADHERLFRLICSQFLQSLSTAAEYKEHFIEIALPLSHHSFKCKSSVLDYPGYLAYSFYGAASQATCDSEEEEDESGFVLKTTQLMDALGSGRKLDSLCEKDLIALDAVELVGHVTTPPHPLTEAELLTLMERYGIGTDASVTTHIANILARDYVRLREGPGNARYMVPTELGVNLCHSITRIDPELTSPRVRSIIEKSCHNIAIGRYKKDVVVQHVLLEFAVKFQHFLRSVEMLKQILNLEEKLNTGDKMSRCGKCRRFMVLVNRSKLICQKCALALTLPMSGRVKVRPVGGDVKCVFDNFELLVAVEPNGKAWCFCPFCWNYAPLGASGASTARFKCLDSDDKLLYGSAYQSGIGPCLAEGESPCSGLMYLQTYSGGCRHGLSCSLCSYHVDFDPTKAKKISKQIFPEERCSKCDWALVNAKLSSASEKCVKACLACDPELAEVFSDSTAFRRKRRTFHKRRPATSRRG